MRFLAAFVLIFATSHSFAAPPDPARTLVDSFVRALTSDDWNEVAALGDRVDSASDRFLDFLDRYECISVRGYRFVRESPTTLRLQIDASGLSRGAAHRELPFPWAWVLEMECDAERCRLRRVETEESRVARLFIEAPPASRAKLEIGPDLDPLMVGRALADLADDMPAWPGIPPAEAERVPYALALDLARQSGDLALESLVWNRLSWTWRVRQNPALAFAMAKAALAAAEASHDPDAIAHARFRMGLTLWGGNDDEACRWLDSAGGMVDGLMDPRIGIKSLYMSAYIKRLHGKIRSFLLDDERVIQLSSQYHWPQGVASAALAIGELHLTTRDYSLAADDFRTAYKNSLRMPGAAFAPEALGGLGMAQMSDGDVIAAAENLRNADRLRNSANGASAVELATTLGIFLMHNGQLAEAEDRLLSAMQQARKLAPWRLAADAATALSQLRLAQKRPAEALAFAREALKAQEGVAVNSVDWSPWHALLAKAKALRALGQTAEAMTALRLAIELVEDQRGAAPADALASARFFEDKVEPYLQLIDMLVDRGNANEAFAYAERMKGRALQDVLAQGNVDRQSILTASEKEEEKTLTQQLAGLNKAALAHPGDRNLRSQISAARLALERFEARAEIAHPAIRIAQPNARRQNHRFPSDLGDGVLIEFVSGERRTIVFAAWRGADGNTEVVARSIAASRHDLEKRVARLEHQIAGRDMEWTRTASSLYDLLLAPVEDALHDHKLICVVPDGVLWRLPFPLLRRDGHDLVERAAVFYAPSLSMLQAAPRRARSTPRRGELIAFGNPAVAGQTRNGVRALTRDTNLGDLPEAESEVRAIAALYGAGQSRIYLRDAARESVFKRQAPRFRILHLAAHGILDDRSPMYSAIVLSASPDEADDGLLEAREILDLRVGSELAVLASCDTARGRVGAGEGVIGMSWAFLIAGCPTTVVSQWQADSRATEALMIAFYRRLRAGDAPAAALQHAQLAVRANPRYQDPLYWAPFIVVGAGMRELAR